MRPKTPAPCFLDNRLGWLHDITRDLCHGGFNPDASATHQSVMSYRAWFQCINPECGEKYPLSSIVYQCKRCHSLLEVQHDTKALAHRSAAAWKKLFEKRYKSNEWPVGSGVWGKKEWILPEIANDNVVSLYEGGT